MSRVTDVLRYTREAMTELGEAETYQVQRFVLDKLNMTATTAAEAGLTGLQKRELQRDRDLVCNQVYRALGVLVTGSELVKQSKGDKGFRGQRLSNPRWYTPEAFEAARVAAVAEKAEVSRRSAAWRDVHAALQAAGYENAQLVAEQGYLANRPFVGVRLGTLEDWQRLAEQVADGAV